MKLQRDGAVDVLKAQIDSDLVAKYKESGAVGEDEIGKWFFVLQAEIPGKILESIWVQDSEDLDPRFLAITFQQLGASILQGYKVA